MRDSILKVLKGINDDGDFENSMDYMQDGLLDSFEIVNLVSELEKIFHVEVQGRDIVPENFINLGAIIQLLQKYKGEL